MAKKRESKVVVTGVSMDEMYNALSDYATSDAKLQKINAQMDVEINRIRDKYSEEVNRLVDSKEKAFEVVQTYAMEKKDELFTKRKSMDTSYGVFGFRTGQPKLKTVKGFTWVAVTSMLKEFLPGYVRITEEPAKDKLLADRDNEAVAAEFARCGISVVQDEAFFIELKKEDVAV